MSEEDVRALVVSLPVIEQAKGVLMGYYGCNADRAIAVMRRWSSVHHVKIRDLAEILVSHAATTREADPAARDRDRDHDRNGERDGEREAWQPFEAIRAFLAQVGLG